MAKLPTQEKKNHEIGHNNTEDCHRTFIFIEREIPADLVSDWDISYPRQSQEKIGSVLYGYEIPRIFRIKPSGNRNGYFGQME